MTKIRRVIVHNIPYFITCRVLPDRAVPTHALGPAVLDALSTIHHRWGADLHAYVVMPDHWHALVTTHEPHDISEVMGDVKGQGVSNFNSLLEEAGRLWQPRFRDHVCRNGEDYNSTLDHIHSNPVKAGFAQRAEQWPWSSWYAYAEGGAPPVPVITSGGDFDVRWAEWRRQTAPLHRRRDDNGPTPPLRSGVGY